MKVAYLAIAGSLLASTLLAGSASAEDGKVLPGSACQPASFRQAAGVAIGGTVISNFSTSNFETVACPVVKDLNKIKRAEVMVVDRNPNNGQDISCTLTTHKKDGSLQQSQTKPTNNSFPNALPLTFAAQTAAPQGSYSLICSLPPMATVAGSPAPSSIVNYNIVED